jgi:hypothetical protein
MEIVTSVHEPTLDETVREAIARESGLAQFYMNAIEKVGPDARLLMHHLYRQHNETIIQLQNLLNEIEELRSLSVAMAD